MICRSIGVKQCSSFSVYRRYHQEIKKRTEPVLRRIAKKRKKKEQETLSKIEEGKIIDKENQIVQKQTTELVSMPLPTTNRLSSPSPNLLTKQTNSTSNSQPRIVPSEMTSKDDESKKKKKKVKQSSTIKSILNEVVVRFYWTFLFSSSQASAQVVQLENPADFVPSIIPERRTIVSPRLPIASPRPSKEQRPKSSTKPSYSPMITK